MQKAPEIGDEPRRPKRKKAVLRFLPVHTYGEPFAARTLLRNKKAQTTSGFFGTISFCALIWHPVGESNPCSRRERAVS